MVAAEPLQEQVSDAEHTFEPAIPTLSGALLHPWLTNVAAHESSVTAGILVQGAADDDTKMFISASMDKTVAAWRLKPVSRVM